jgi:hypothetical protein
MIGRKSGDRNVLPFPTEHEPEAELQTESPLQYDLVVEDTHHLRELIHAEAEYPQRGAGHLRLCLLAARA